MIIYCDSGGNVSSVPSVVSFGETLRDITIIAHQTSSTAVLKIKPPNAEYLPDIICAPLLTEDATVVYVAHLPKSVTTVSGRCLYQIEFVSPEEYTTDEGDIIQDIKKWRSFDGSFNVARAVETNFPATEDELKEQSLDTLYAMLASVKRLYDEVAAVENTIGVGKDLETTSQNLIDAMNELYRNGHGITEEVAQRIAQYEILLHNGANDAHADIRALIKNVSDKLSAFLDVDDDTLNQVSEIIAYVDQHKDILESKVNKADIVDNLETATKDAPLSANQGVVLKQQIGGVDLKVIAINQRLDGFVDEVLSKLPIAEEVSV